MKLEVLESYGFRPKAPEVLDSSMLKDYVDCPSMFYLRHVLGLKKAYSDPTYEAKFDWGTCWHTGLEAYWTPGEFSREERIVMGVQAIDQNYPTYITPEVDRHKRSKDRMLRAFLDYHEHWKEQDADMEILRTEQYFNVYSDEEDLAWCGRIDNIRLRKLSGVILPWDYKTASVMGKDYFDAHEVGFQFPGYVWATNHLMTQPVMEIGVDVMYMISASHDFFRRTFRYIPERLNEWRENVKMIRDEILYLLENHLYEPERWRKNWNQCTRYGRCQFFDVHSIAPVGDVRMRILASDYVEDRWDPANLMETD